MEDELKEQMDAQEASNLRASAQQTGLRAAEEHKQRTVHNENFLRELRKVGLDIDDDLEKSLEEEFPTWFAAPKAVTNRGDDWELQSDLQMMNKRERAVARGRPGRLLRDRPWIRAVMERNESPPLEAYDMPGIPGDREDWRRVVSSKETTDPVVDSKDKARIYGGAEVAADLMTLSRNGAGLESVSTVKTETAVRRSEEDESTTEKVGRVLE